MIATPAHRAAFEAELAAGGLDTQAARGAGRYLELDAAETLALFSGGGSVDREAYFAVVGALVRQAVATGRRVRAYGEMVALLWDAGDVLAAIELEALWNELGRQVAFSLYCAYPKASVSEAGQAQALENVCHLHSSVIGSIDARTLPRSARTMQAAVNLPAQPTAPGAARRFVVASLGNWGYGGAVVQDAAAVVTELATNAVVHTGSAFEVSLRAAGALVRIRVQDPSRAVPASPGCRHAPGMAWPWWPAWRTAGAWMRRLTGRSCGRSCMRRGHPARTGEFVVTLRKRRRPR